MVLYVNYSNFEFLVPFLQIKNETPRGLQRYHLVKGWIIWTVSRHSSEFTAIGIVIMELFPKGKKARYLAEFIVKHQLKKFFLFLTVPSWILPLCNKRSWKNSEDTSDKIKLYIWIPSLLKTHSRTWHCICGKLIDTNSYLMWCVIVYFLMLKLFSLDSMNLVRYKKSKRCLFLEISGH